MKRWAILFRPVGLETAVQESEMRAVLRCLNARQEPDASVCLAPEFVTNSPLMTRWGQACLGMLLLPLDLARFDVRKREASPVASLKRRIKCHPRSLVLSLGGGGVCQDFEIGAPGGRTAPLPVFAEPIAG